MHYLRPDGNPGSDNSPECPGQMQVGGGQGDNGERGSVEMSPQMDATRAQHWLVGYQS